MCFDAESNILGRMRGTTVRFGWACVALLVVAAASDSACGADRVVLCEEFTQVTGAPCAYGGLALGMLLDDYPDSVTLVQAHVVGEYATTWGANRFWYFYYFSATPSLCFDGVDRLVGSYSIITQTYSWYCSRYLARQGVFTDVTITLSAAHVSDSTYEITARVCVEPGGTGKTMRICMVQVLDHWPAYPTYHRNGLKQAATTADVTVAPGDCQDLVRVFTFDSDSWTAKNDIKIVAWAQEPLTSYPAEVYQAAWMGWPLVPVPGDFDDDGDADLQDHVGFVDCMAGPGATPYPTPPATAQECLDAFSIDDDDVDLMDFVAFQTVFAEQP